MSEDTSGLKRTRRTSEKNLRSYPDVVLQSLTRFNISEKPPPHVNDLEQPNVDVRKEVNSVEKSTPEEEKEEKLPSAPYYKDLRKSKLKNEKENRTDVENVQILKIFESDEKKFHNYENFEENRSDNLSNIIVASPRRRKQKASGNCQANEKSGLIKVKDEPAGCGDQHIYEEIIPCSSGNSEGLKGGETQAEFPSEHIYAELQQRGATKRPNKFLLRLRSSMFRLWAAVTPWPVARRVFWRRSQAKEEDRGRPSRS